MVRPEDILLHAVPDGPYTIVGKTFMGSHTEYVVEGDGKRMEASLFGRQNSELEIGARVSMEIGHTFFLNE